MELTLSVFRSDVSSGGGLRSCGFEWEKDCTFRFREGGVVVGLSALMARGANDEIDIYDDIG